MLPAHCLLEHVSQLHDAKSIIATVNDLQSARLAVEGKSEGTDARLCGAQRRGTKHRRSGGWPSTKNNP
jgi:hypothetical protein